MAELAGRIALVTGGGRGIGRAVALALAAEGADVAVAARSSDELEETVSGIRAAGRRGEAILCDVTQRSNVDAMIARVRSALGDADGWCLGPSAGRFATGTWGAGSRDAGGGAG